AVGAARVGLWGEPRGGVHRPDPLPARLPGGGPARRGQQPAARRPHGAGALMVSRVTTSLLYRELVTRVGRLQTRLAAANDEVSSQRRLREASNDPSGAALAARLQGEKADVGAVRSALGFATQVVARQDLALDQSDRILARAREIATLTANGTATVESRQQAAVEVAELERGLLAQANTELSGRYVFAGLTSGAAPFASLDDSGFDPLNPYSG